MNFFKSSFFSDFKLPDVLALNEEDQVSSSQESETLVSPEAEGATLRDAKVLPDLQSEGPIKELASSDAKGIADRGEEAPVASGEGSTSQEEEEKKGIWGLGGFVKSLTLKSEDLLQAYRKDLEDFGSGLKKETQIIAEVAVHVVKELPTSLETSAFLAQDSIESVGQVVEDFSSSVWRGTTDLIAQGKEAVLRIDEDESSISSAPSLSFTSSVIRHDNVPVPMSGGKYSRFEAQVRAMQHDSSTYCDEPGDLTDYMEWKYTFSLADRRHDIDTLVAENTFLQELLFRFVPDVVSEETFWTRYFYQFHKLQQTEEVRADLVKRANALEEEDLNWDTEEELEEGGTAHDEEAQARSVEVARDMVDGSVSPEGKRAVDSKVVPGKDVVTEGSHQSHVDDPQSGVEGPSKALPEREDDLGWDVAEDVRKASSNNRRRSSNSEASWEVPDAPREDLRKQFSAQVEEEDLSWDVDDGIDETK